MGAHHQPKQCLNITCTALQIVYVVIDYWNIWHSLTQAVKPCSAFCDTEHTHMLQYLSLS